tara:strand:- start:283 stop:1413 length:1131 start_codon:yes stop_codon:yes gene_type:complete
MAVTINEKIRFFKANDPYYYEVDNLPLIDLLENDKSLRDEINDILLNNQVWATENFVTDRIQLTIGTPGTINISGDGSTVPNNVVAWVLGKNFITLDDVDGNGEEILIPIKVDDFLDVESQRYSQPDNRHHNKILTWVDSNNPNREGGQQYFKSRAAEDLDDFPRVVYLENRYFFLGQEKPAGAGAQPSDRILMTDRTPPETPETELDGFLFDDPFISSTTDPTRENTFIWKRFVRRFSDIGLPENAKKIYGRFGINQMPDSYRPSHFGNTIFMLEHCHSPVAPAHPDVVSWNPNLGTYGNVTSHAHELITLTEGDSQSASTKEHVCDFTVHYGNEITMSRRESPYTHEPVLTFQTRQEGSFKILNLFLYIYAYET